MPRVAFALLIGQLSGVTLGLVLLCGNDLPGGREGQLVITALAWPAPGAPAGPHRAADQA